MYFVTFVKPVGNVTLMVWLLPLFIEREDVALASESEPLLSNATNLILLSDVPLSIL